MAVGPWELLIFILVCGVPLLLGIVLVAVLLGRSRSTSTGPSKSQSALEILEQRYVRGEIDSEEFEERRNRILRSSQQARE